MLRGAKVDDSDSESLPDLSQFISTPPTGLSKGDIVWAKYRNLYWPALVRSIYKKKKKISVWYTDEPGKTFILSMKNVCPFYDAEMTAKIVKDVREAGCIQEHEGLSSHASRYLKRRAQGYVDDPMKYFDQTYPFFLIEELLKTNPDADVSSIKIPPLYISKEKKNVRKSAKAPKVVTVDAESEIETTGSDSESDAENVTKDYVLQIQQEYSSLSRDEENVDKIVEFVKSGKADSYLQKILSGRFPSEHRNFYEKIIKQRKKVSCPLSYTGPIENDEKIRELIFYLLSLYDNVKNVQKSGRRSTRQCTKKLNYPSYDKTMESEYVASVWLPESIIYAMSATNNVSLSDAKKLFNESSESQTQDIQNIISSLGSGETSCSSGIDKKKFVEVNCKKDSEICAPLKKKKKKKNV